MTEQWRDIANFEGYQVSSRGRVRSLDRTVLVSGYESERCARPTFIRKLKGRILKPGPHPSGHVMVVLGAGNTHSVHRLVAEAFHGPCPDGHEVLHLNHSPADNRAANLKWGTRSENLKMDYARGIDRLRGCTA